MNFHRWNQNRILRKVTASTRTIVHFAIDVSDRFSPNSTELPSSNFFSLSFRPQSLSTEVCSGRPFMNRLATNASPATPMSTCQSTRKLSANAMRTFVLSGSSKVRMTGMIEYAMDVPPGNWETKSPGSRLRSSFCRTAPPIVTPHTCEKKRTNIKNASAGALSVTGRGARTGKNVEVINVPIPKPRMIWYPMDAPRLESKCNVLRRPAPTTRQIHANQSWGL